MVKKKHKSTIQVLRLSFTISVIFLALDSPQVCAQKISPQQEESIPALTPTSTPKLIPTPPFQTSQIPSAGESTKKGVAQDASNLVNAPEFLYQSQGNSLYSIGVIYSTEEYSDDQVNQLKNIESHLETKIQTTGARFSYLSNDFSLLTLKLTQGSVQKEEWISKSTYFGSLGFVLRIYGELVPFVGLRKITSEVQLDKLRSSKINILGSTDYFAGASFSTRIATISDFSILVEGSYSQINPGNSVDYGQHIEANISILFPSGAYTWNTQIGIASESYQAQQKFDTTDQELLSVSSKTNSLKVTISAWYDPSYIDPRNDMNESDSSDPLFERELNSSEGRGKGSSAESAEP